MKSPSATSGSKSSSNTIVTVILVAIVVGGLAFIFWPRSARQAPPAPTQTSAASNTAPVVAESAPTLKAIAGSWVREDGGYRLELSVDSSQQLHAAYFNPNPINVSYAAATNDGGTLKLRVELNDTSYPGCVYTLVHDRVNDRLVGTYYQAAIAETYEIMFNRQP